MKFEIQVSQRGSIIDEEGFVGSCSTVVAVFMVGADTVEAALLKMGNTKEFKNIDQVEKYFSIGVIGGMPRFEIDI